jgi:hypothetical protein
MGRRKDAKPRRNLDTLGDTVQLGAWTADYDAQRGIDSAQLSEEAFEAIKYPIGTKVKKVCIATKNSLYCVELERLHLHLITVSTLRVTAGSLAKSQLTTDTSILLSTKMGTGKNMMIERWTIVC